MDKQHRQQQRQQTRMTHQLQYNVTHGNQELLTIADKHRDDVILLDFYADWCGPCKRIAPKVHELVETYNNARGVRRVILCSINVDIERNEDAVQAYKVNAMPTFVWIRDMHTVERVEGADIEAISKITQHYAVPRVET